MQNQFLDVFGAFPDTYGIGLWLATHPTSAGGKHSNASSKASTTASTRGAASRVM